jgi:hypothetical protein
VRYSRVRNSWLDFLMATVRFLVFGARRGIVEKPLRFGTTRNETVRFILIVRTVYHASINRTMGRLLATPEVKD